MKYENSKTIQPLYKLDIERLERILLLIIPLILATSENMSDRSYKFRCCQERENLQPLTLIRFIFSYIFILLTRFSLKAAERFAVRAVK